MALSLFHPNTHANTLPLLLLLLTLCKDNFGKFLRLSLLMWVCVCVGVAPWISAFEEPKQSRSITERPPHGNYSANNEAQLRQLCILGLIQWGLLQRASTGLRLIGQSKLEHRLRGCRTCVDIGNNSFVSWLPSIGYHQTLNSQLV